MANKWILHVKKFASDNNVSYGCAISDPRCKSSYVKPDKNIEKENKINNMLIETSKNFIKRYKASQPDDINIYKSKFNLYSQKIKDIIKEKYPNIYNKLN
jgi:hypothetical protein